MIIICYLPLFLKIVSCSLAQTTLHTEGIQAPCSASSSMYSADSYPDHTMIPLHLNNFIGKDFSECSEMLYQHHVAQWYWGRGGGIILISSVKAIDNNNLVVWDSIKIKLKGRRIVSIEGTRCRTLLITHTQKNNLLKEYEIAKKERVKERMGPMWWRVDIALINHMSRTEKGGSIIWELP